MSVRNYYGNLANRLAAGALYGVASRFGGDVYRAATSNFRSTVPRRSFKSVARTFHPVRQSYRVHPKAMPYVRRRFRRSFRPRFRRFGRFKSFRRYPVRRFYRRRRRFY